MGGAKLGAAHAETGAAVWALGDKTVLHASAQVMTIKKVESMCLFSYLKAKSM